MCLNPHAGWVSTWYLRAKAGVRTIQLTQANLNSDRLEATTKELSLLRFKIQLVEALVHERPQ